VLKIPSNIVGATRTHEFDLLVPNAKSSLKVRYFTASDLPKVRSLLDKHISGPTATDDAIQYTRMRNRNNVLLFCREGEIVGLYAMLMLTALGLERLLLAEFDPIRPDHTCLALRQSAPAAIYQWAVIAPHTASEGIRHISQFLREPLYRHANLFARPTTAAGKRICENVGFTPVAGSPIGLHRYVRLANRPAALSEAA